MYAFLLNMWIMHKINESYLDKLVDKGRISADERDMIVATPQA